MDKIELIGMDATHVAYLDNFENPLINEQINAGYMFSFTAFVDDKTQFISFVNRVRLEGQQFDIARITKKRDAIPSIDVECDHVSYRLNRPLNYEEDFEGSPAQIVAWLLHGTAFSPGIIDFSEIVYFAPGEKSIRECLIELANYVGGELRWDNFEVDLLQRRGANNGLEFKLGENIEGLSFETDLTEGIPRYALEVDVLDLAHHPDYAAVYDELKKVHLGDSVRVYDPVLNIDIVQRVVNYDRDPFQKITPKVSIGNVIRDITEYLREQEDKEDETEEDTSIHFKGGGFFMVDNEPPEDAPNGGTAVIDFLAGTTQALNIVGADITDQFKAGLSADYASTNVEDPNEPVTIRMSEAVLDFYTVLVKVGTRSYGNTDFKNGLLVVEGDFPNDVEVFISDGELSASTIVKAYGLHVDVVAIGEGFYIEFGTVKLTNAMTFEFNNTAGYDSVASVTTGIRGEERYDSPVIITTKEIYTGDKVTGILAMCNDSGETNMQVSIQAICKSNEAGMAVT